MSNEKRWSEGLIAAQNRDFEKAFECWLPLAEEGNPLAQVNLAYLHLRRLIEKADRFIGEYWLNEASACDQPEVSAMVEIIEKQLEIDVYHKLHEGFG